MKTLKLLTISLLLTQLSTLSGYDIFDDERTNIWVDNGVNSRSFYLLNWSENADLKGSTIIVNTQSISDAVDKEPNRVLVNNIPTSYPAFSEYSFLPNLSLVGLDAPSNAVGEALNKPILSIYPDGGDFDETVAITLRLNAPKGSIEKIWYEVDTKITELNLQASDGNNTLSIYLSKAGTHLIKYKIKNDADTKTATFNLSNSDTKRDSDGDGIPDSVEIELGLNPLSEIEYIKGWTPFDVMVRNNDINDSDGDGWSDFDETQLRGTDADDNRSKPTADSLYGVEYIVNSSASFSSVSRVSFLDMLSSPLYDSSKLQDINLSNEYYNIAISSLTNGDLNNTLENATIPTVRISAKVPVIQRMRATDANNSKVYKSFIASSEDLSVQSYYELFKESDVTLFSASDFISSYLEYLSNNLVVDKTLTLNDANSIDVTILEASLRSRVASETLLLLGNPNFKTPYEAYINTQNALGETQRGFNELFSDLQTLISTYTLETLGLEDVLLLDTNTSEINLAKFMQDSLDKSDRYRISLMSIIDFKTAELNVSVMNLDADTDKDSLLNSQEVLAVNYSNPLLGDSDSDGISDALDPCVNDIQNACMNDAVTNEDSDGDGIVDSADNCPFNVDSSQADSDGDGIGDACSKKGLVMTTPRTNIELFQGDSFTFKATKTEGATGAVSWFLNGDRDTTVTEEEYTYTFTNVKKNELCASLKTTIGDDSTCVTVNILAKEPSLALLTLYTTSITETDSGTKDALIELSLASPSTKNRTYTFETLDDSAQKVTDYIETTGSFTFETGERRKYISIPIVGDTTHETEELFSLYVYPDIKGEGTTKLNIHIFDNDAASPDENTTEPPVTTLVQNNIFFEFQTDASGSEPWISDGSETNSTLLKDIQLDENGSYPRNFTKIGSDILFFSASNSDGQQSLYLSGGSSETTVSLGILDGYEASNFIDVNGTLFFTLIDASDSTKKLYKSNGESITLVTSLSRGYESTSMGDYFTLVGNDLYFSSDILSADDYDNELHKFDTQTETITLVKDIEVGSGSSYPSMLTPIDESLYFVTQNRNIYKSDGTEAGTILIDSLDENKSIYNLEYVNGTLYYSVSDYNQGTLDIVSLDLASATQIAHIHYEDATYISHSFSLGDKYYITTNQASEYKIISLLGELVTEEFVSDKYINQVKTLDDRFYFLNSDGLICSSDYNTVIKNAVDGDYISFIEGSLNGELYFKVYNKSTQSLYKADSVSVTLLVDGNPAP